MFFQNECGRESYQELQNIINHFSHSYYQFPLCLSFILNQPGLSLQLLSRYPWFSYTPAGRHYFLIPNPSPHTYKPIYFNLSSCFKLPYLSVLLTASLSRVIPSLISFFFSPVMKCAHMSPIGLTRTTVHCSYASCSYNLISL